MQEIREALARLTEGERKRLMHAFETLASDLVMFQDGTFIGCHLGFTRRGNLAVTTVHGVWSTGRTV